MKSTYLLIYFAVIGTLVALFYREGANLLGLSPLYLIFFVVCGLVSIMLAILSRHARNPGVMLLYPIAIFFIALSGAVEFMEGPASLGALPSQLALNLDEAKRTMPLALAYLAPLSAIAHQAISILQGRGNDAWPKKATYCSQAADE